MDPGPPAHPREFAAAFLGHSQDSHGDLECNFRVTHLPSGVFWLVRRPLSDWQHLEERLLREAGKIQRPASARGCTGSSRRSSGHAQLGGFFFRRSSDVSRKQLEKLQAQLAEMLSDSELRDSTVLQDFLGVPGQAPEMPSSVRIVKLRRRQDGDAEVQLEVQTTSERALVESRTAATHVVATVLLLRPRAGAEEDLEEIGDFKVPASSPELLTIHGLVADRAYEFQVKAVNDVGSSPSVRIRVLVPTDLPGPEEPSSEGPPTAPREPSKETAAQVSNAHAAEPSAAVPFTTEAAASQPSPEAAAAAAPDPQPSPEVDTLTKVAVPGTQPLPAADALAEAILKPAVEPTAAVEDVAEAVASHLPALDVDTLTEATSAHAVERTAAVEVAAPGTQPSAGADARDALDEVILRPTVEPAAAVEDVAEAVAFDQPAPEVDTLAEATSAVERSVAVEVAAPAATQPSPEADAPDALAEVILRPAVKPTADVEQLAEAVASDQPAQEVDTLVEATEVAAPAATQPSLEADAPDAVAEVPAEVILRPAVEPTAAVEDVAEAVASHQPAPEVDTLAEATSANAVERTAAVEVAGPATQPSPEADAPDALAEVTLRPPVQPTAAVEEAPEVDTLTEATSAHAVERTAAVEVAAPGTQPSPKADAPDVLAEVPAEVILRPAVEPTASIEDVAEAVASHQPAPEVDTLTEATSAHAVEGTAVEVAAPGTQPSPEADVLAQVPTEVSDQPAPEVDTLTEATSAHAVERTAAVEVAGPGMQPSPEADTPDALDEVPTEVILRPAEEPTAAVEDVAEAVASDQPAPEADTLVEATSALAVERAAVEVAAPGTQPSPEADVLAEVPTEVSDQPAPEVDTLTEVQPSQSPDPDARREIHAEPQPLRNGSSQSQSQSAGRLKPQQAAGDPYLSPHARALVNDQEDADFVNTEEARSPQRESSARSLQPPSAGYARVGSLEVRLSQLPDKKAPGAAVDQAIAHLETHYKISEQAALRLYLGCNLDMEEAKRRFDGILEWRKQYGLDQLRQSLSAALPGEAAVTAPFHKEVAKLVTINPCVLTSVEGSPVSIYYVGTAHASAAAKAEEEQLRRFGVFMAEYVDIWLSAQTSSTGRLAGHVQIYDLQGLSLWQVSSGALVEKLKILLGAGQHYMEQVSHIFVIRSSSAFSMAWNFIKGWISPRTASKIHVSSSIPTELQKLLGPSAAALPALLKNPHWTAAVQRPPFPTEE